MKKLDFHELLEMFRRVSLVPRSFPGIVILMLFLQRAGVAELADARDSKSRDLHWSCGFDPHLQHQQSVRFLLNFKNVPLNGYDHALAAATGLRNPC